MRAAAAAAGVELEIKRLKAFRVGGGGWSSRGLGVIGFAGFRRMAWGGGGGTGLLKGKRLNS